MQDIQNLINLIKNASVVDKLTEVEVQNLDSNNLFLAIIEPKDLYSPELTEILSTLLDKDYLKEQIIETCEQVDNIEERVFEIQKFVFSSLDSIKENRKFSISSEITVLASINDQLYDLKKNAYLDLDEYYINHAKSFHEIFDDNQWQLYFDNGLTKIIIGPEALEKIKKFIEANQETIDKNAKQKILKSKKGN